MHYRIGLKGDIVECSGWTEEDGCMYLDRTSPSEYEPEPIIAILDVDLKSEEGESIFEPWNNSQFSQA